MKKRIYLVIVLAVVICGGFFAGRFALIQINKWQFPYADTAVRAVFNGVVMQKPKPIVTAVQNSCARLHREFGSGPLSCTVSSVAVYVVGTVSEANRLQHSLSDYVRQHSGKFVYWNSNGRHDFTSGQNEYSSEAYTLAKTSMTCGPSYSISPASRPEPGLPNTSASSGYLLAFRMSCTRSALRQFYPRSDT